MCLFWFELDIHRQDQILQFPNSRDVCLSKFGMEGNPDTFFFGISLKRYLHIAPLSEQKNAVKFSHGGEAMGCGVSAFKKYAASEVAKNTVRSCLHISLTETPIVGLIRCNSHLVYVGSVVSRVFNSLIYPKILLPAVLSSTTNPRIIVED